MNEQEELVKGNTELQAALGVAHEAIEKEKGGIKALQEQLQSGKAEVIGNGTGPSDEDLARASLASSASNPSIASSIENQPASDKKKKSKTKKVELSKMAQFCPTHESHPNLMFFSVFIAQQKFSKYCVCK